MHTLLWGNYTLQNYWQPLKFAKFFSFPILLNLTRAVVAPVRGTLTKSSFFLPTRAKVFECMWAAETLNSFSFRAGQSRALSITPYLAGSVLGLPLSC